MGEKAKRRFDLKYNILKSELLFERENMQSLTGSFIFGDVLLNKEKNYNCKNIEKIINMFEEFPTVVGSAEDRNGSYVIISISKTIPSNIRKKLLFVPRDTVAITMVDINEHENKITEDDYFTILITFDNYGELVIVSHDNRFRKKNAKLTNCKPSEEIMQILKSNIECYFSVFNAFIKSDYVLEYDFKGSVAYFPLIDEDVKDLFKSREKTNDRRQPLAYGVKEFTNKNNISITSHMRGFCEFKMDNRNLKLLIGVNKWRNFDKEKNLMLDNNLKAGE